MQIKNLEGISTAEIAQTFNEAFSDYLIPISLTESDLAAKMKSENTKPEFSAGVFADGKLVGFILIGIDNGIAYNGGTGVIPTFRGQNLAAKMYDFLLPLLAENGITSHLLEVITENAKAIPVYKKIGFEITRTVACFKGKVLSSKSDFATIRKIDFPEHQEKWCDFKPTYQNSMAAISRTKEMHETLGAFADGKLVGYAIFIESSGRIKQFAVAPKFRKKGIGWQLFDEMQKRIGDTRGEAELSEAKPMLLINVDESAESMDFLKTIGLEVVLRQYEMVYDYTRLR